MKVYAEFFSSDEVGDVRIMALYGCPENIVLRIS